MIVEFHFGSYEETFYFQFEIEHISQLSLLLLDFKQCVKEIIKETIKEEQPLDVFNEKYYPIDDIVYKLPKCLSKRGWKEPNVIRKYYADLWGKLIVDKDNPRFVTFHDEEPQTEIEKIFDEAYKEVMQEITFQEDK